MSFYNPYSSSPDYAGGVQDLIYQFMQMMMMKKMMGQQGQQGQQMGPTQMGAPRFGSQWNQQLPQAPMGLTQSPYQGR